MGFTKRAGSHARAAQVEAAGLRWLKEAEADGGPRIVTVLEVTEDALTLEELHTSSATAEAAEAFGAALARMHRSLDPHTHFGQLPPEHPAEVPFLFGPADALQELGTAQYSSWGAFHATERLDPILTTLKVQLTPDQAKLLHAARDKIAAGAFDHATSPSRIHGDLWSGNVLWTPTGAALIDPAAHAGHRESDLAMLQLFGLPYLDQVFDAYQHEHPLEPGWEDRVPIHQFFYLAAHWMLFGAGYAEATLTAAQRTLDYEH